MIREPAVSGQFYPADKEKLSSLIESFLPKEIKKISAKALILPHAGFIYSGRVAVVAASQVMAKKTVVILGPNHTGFGKDFALWAKGMWKIPTADINIASKLAQMILEKGDCISEDYLAHKFEHSIEVELPILGYFFGDFNFVPIICQVANFSLYEKVAAQIYEGIKSVKDEVLLVASTDMTHYEPDASARKKDREALEYIINLDAEGLVKKVNKDDISMCGVAPVAILINLLNRLGARKAQVALYQTSGDSSGDYSSVVGYAGLIIS
jgi:AmmeMemoRadiSam system protein B